MSDYLEETNQILADFRRDAMRPAFVLPPSTPPLLGVGFPDARFRWDVAWGTVPVIQRPLCYFEGFPPLPDESLYDYLDRMVKDGPRPFAPPLRLYRARWWQFWRKRRP